MEQSNWSAAMLSLQMLKYYCRLSKKRMKTRKTVCFLTEKNNQLARMYWKGRSKLLKNLFFLIQK
ncbi:hypothetical protein FY048_18115 [Acinetobacter sp. 1124_18A]